MSNEFLSLVKDPLLSVTIKTKEKVYFDGKGYTITSVNDGGTFDILPTHANFITLIKLKVIIDVGRPTEQLFNIEKGIMYVMSNKIDIYVGI